MKLTAIILLASCLQISAKGVAQNVTLSLKNVPIEKAFKEIKKQTGYNFIYYKAVLGNTNNIDLSVKNEGLENVLEIIFKGQPITYTISGRYIAIKKKEESVSTPVSLNEPPPFIEIHGKIVNQQGEPLQNVSVLIASTTIGTSTDRDGRFTLNAPDKKNIELEISSVGYQSKKVSVGTRTEINIILEQDASGLNEVVITALGIKREKRQLTYSTQVVKGDELVQAKEPNLINALAGKVSGVQVISSNGSPGTSASIVIRGATSVLGNNEALVVIDGVPINNDETGTLSIGAGSNRLVDIDPQAVESIDVLKGAAATALYGSAGARGVVLITTKSGKTNKKPSVNFSSDLSFEKGIFPERQTKYAQGTGGVFYNGDSANRKTSLSWGPLMDTLKINGQSAKKYDPYALFFRTGVTTNNTVSLNGGGASSSYFMSYSYFDQQGIIPQNEFKRHSLFIKNTNNISKNLSATFQLTYSNSNQAISSTPLFVLYVQPVSWNPLPYLDDKGNQRVFRFSRNNPFWELNNIHTTTHVNRFLPVATFNYTPKSWLTITERIGADIYAEQDAFSEAPSALTGGQGRIVNVNTNFRQFNHDLIVSATKEFGDFSVNLLLGNNLYSNYNQISNVTGVGLSIDNYDNIAGAATIVASENHYLQRKVGFYSQATIDYKRMLILSLTGRYDGSSVLAESNRFYPYGSAAAGFIFSELFPSSVSKVFNFGKLRLSYATVGNDNVGPYQIRTPYYSASFSNTTFPFRGQPGFLLSTVLGNPDLRNERLNEYEVGLETRFFNNRIGFEASYFYKKSVDGIIPGVSVSPSSGYQGTTVNTASIENKGIEILLTATPIRTKNFRWDMTFNFTKIRNKVLALYPGIDQLGRIIVGQPYNVFYGTRYKRNSNGEVIINDKGLPITDDSQGIVGDITPDWLAGLNSTLRYKRFSLSFLFDMKQGGDVANANDGYADFYGTSKGSENRAPRILVGVSEVDGKANTVAVDAQTYYSYRNTVYESTIQDGTYIKLRNLSFSYDFAPSIFGKVPFKSVSFAVTGRNLWIYSPNFTGADPEVSSYGTANGNTNGYYFSTPTSRSIDFSLKFGF